MRRWLLVLGAAAVASCTDHEPGDGPDMTVSELPVELQVSNPVGQVMAGGASLSILPNVQTEDLVYVALPTGSAPEGVRAAVRRVGDELPLVVPVEDGGFDPIAVRAGPTDSVEVVVLSAVGGVVLSSRASVRPKRPPTVVRTYPPRKKSDMPVNASMVVVFSEPLHRPSVTPSSVQLFIGRRQVGGTVSVLNGGTSVAFTPAAALEPNSDYRLVIHGSVTDLDGDPLEEDVVLPFSTGVGTLGEPARIVVSPDSLLMVDGSSYQYSAQVFDANGNRLLTPVAWISTSVSVLIDPATALVRARMINPWAQWDDAQIVARAGRAEDTAFVTVVTQPASVQLLPSAATLGVGDTITLNVVTRSVEGVRIPVPLTVTIDNKSVVSVESPDRSAIQASPFRIVKALAPGAARITIRAGGVSASANFAVIPPPAVVSLRVAPAAAEMAPQETLQLTPWMRDATGRYIQDGRPVSWSSSDGTVLTVTGSGRVTAVATGSATITASIEGRTSSTTISVSAQPAAPRFISLAASSFSTCAVTTEGDAYCWGEFYEGVRLRDLVVPTLLPGGLDLVGVTPANGFYFDNLCGRTGSGAAFCWANYNLVPTRFAASLAFSDLRATIAGNACGITASGSAYCWGGNWSGEVGDGTFSARTTATAVVGGHTFTSIATGPYHTCGVTTVGDAYCWGRNTDGTFGIHTSDPPVGRLGTGDSTTERISTPTRVAGGLSFTRLSAGAAHSCGITVARKAYCWGFNRYGQLGDGTRTNRHEPAAVSTSLEFTDISAGDAHTCAITTSGAAYCWGDNTDGALGVGTALCTLFDIPCSSPLPIAVEGNLSFAAIAAGLFKTCALTTTGKAYCWGTNTWGQLGDGTQTDRHVPTAVARP